MLAGRIAHLSVLVSHHTQVMSVVVECGLAVFDAKIYGKNVLHISGTVELAKIYHKLLLLVHLKRLCHIRNATQLAGYSDYKFRIGCMLCVFIDDLPNPCLVFRLIIIGDRDRVVGVGRGLGGFFICR